MSRALIQPSGQVIGRPRQGGLYMWALALLVGALAAFAVIAIRNLVDFASFLAFNAPRGRFYTNLADLVWWKKMLGPIVGGAIIALMLRVGVSMGWGPAPRAFGVTDVAQNRRLRGTIRSTTMGLRDSLWSALISIVSLGWGGSAGREEPAAHLGASLALLPGRLLGLDIAARRMLVGMGVAAAIAAALHAPLAGIFLARELVMRRQRLSAMGPVAIASVTGWVVALTSFQGQPVVNLPLPGAVLPAHHIVALVSAPLLAFFAWGAVVVWARTPVMMASAAGRMHIPLWLLPFFGGVLLGVVALAFPQAMGIGFDPVAAAVGRNYGAQLLPVLALVKIAATAITFAFRWGGGAIAPALYVGAMFGSAFGAAAGLVLPDPSTVQIYLGVLGMAIAVAILLKSPFTAGMLALELSRSLEIGVASLAGAFIAVMAVRRLAPTTTDDEGEQLRWR
jgi:CIC family chloride channel protein